MTAGSKCATLTFIVFLECAKGQSGVQLMVPSTKWDAFYGLIKMMEYHVLRH